MVTWVCPNALIGDQVRGSHQHTESSTSDEVIGRQHGTWLEGLEYGHICAEMCRSKGCQIVVPLHLLVNRVFLQQGIYS
jgi:hypothetical protein